MSDTKKSIMGTVKVSAEIAKKSALIKKRELTDLNAVHAKLGDYALRNQTGKAQLTEQFAAIESLDAEVQKKRTHDAVADSATFADKARHAATVAKDSAAVEALLFRRKSLIAELGRNLCGYEIEDETIMGLQQEAQNIQAELDKLKSEISELEQSVSGVAKKPFLAGAIAIIGLVVIVGALAGLKSSCSRSGQIKRATREANQAAADINREVASMQQQMLEAEMQMKNEQLEEAERRKLERAQADLEAKQRQLEEQRERAQREQQRLAADLEAQQKAAERERQRRIEEQDRQEKDQAKRVQEQKDRATLAQTRFSQVVLDPNFYPSRTVLAGGAAIEVRGKNWDQIKNLHQGGDWLALINALRGQSYTEYPEAYQIERAVDQLLSYDLYVLCRTSLRQEGRNRLVLLTLPISTYRAVGVSIGWEPHPDGIGFTHKWSPSHGGGIILYGDYDKQYSGRVEKINEAFLMSKEGLGQKLKLGEITAATHSERLAELVRRAHAAAITWAKQQ